jgi:short-subunit dehydrogenase
MTQLAGKVVWITGASSGIGEAMALLAARRGARLVLSARRKEELERVRGLCPDPAQVAVLPLDLSAFDAAAAARQAEAFFGGVDVLVNNAGISQRSLFKDTQLDVYRRIMELDFFAPVALSKALLDGMRQRGGGHVVMIGSVVSRVGVPMRTGYSAAKHALAGFTDAARGELWRDGVKFTLACPGSVRTEVSKNARIWRAVERDVEEIHIGREKSVIQLKRLAPGLASFVLKRAKVT